MPSYSEIVQTDLSALTSAADGWKAMATQFKTMEDVYKDEVQSVSAGNGWMGSSAQTAATNAGMTRGEFASAQKEALAMESLLRDAHTRFTDLKGRVKSAVADAEAAGMKVSDQGIASYDFAKVSGDTAKAIRHDPDLPEVERSWTRRIGDAVKAVTEFDADVKTALLNASGADGTAMFGFNSKPVGDVEAVEALALTSKVRDGKASPEELRHYNEILKQNGDDKHFSEAYLHALGAKDTLDLADRMNLAANDRGTSAADKNLYESINAGLASTVASGTKDPASYAYKPFVDGLKEQGPELVGKGLPTHGYQALVTLMGKGDGYGKQFLNDIGDGIIEAEKDDPTMYAHAYDPKRPNLVADPLDGLLGIMAKDPDSATYFLDPDAAGNKNEHLKYLLDDREWQDPGSRAPTARRWRWRARTRRQASARPSRRRPPATSTARSWARPAPTPRARPGSCTTPSASSTGTGRATSSRRTWRACANRWRRRWSTTSPTPTRSSAGRTPTWAWSAAATRSTGRVTRPRSQSARAA